MKQDTIAVIITCYNRKEKTVECLRRLKQNRLPKGYAVVIILVDDNSTDRTADAILEEYPATQIIKGDGNLYWNGGMRTGIAAALKGKADFHLWLNDDTLLFSNAVESLLRCYEKVQTDLGAEGIIVGSTCDELTGEPTYGGLVRRSPWRPVKFELVSPRDSYQECETMNGNCVLVPRSVAEKIGNLEERFAHGMGDLDYGLRAKNTGYWIAAMPGYAGHCSRNSGATSFENITLPLARRMRLMFSPKGLPPLTWLIFTHRHGGPIWFIYWLWPYLKVISGSCHPLNRMVNVGRRQL